MSDATRIHPALTPDQAPIPALSIVIPAYNEAKRLPRTLATIVEYLGRPAGRTVTAGAGGWELLVADDGSTDGTPDIVAREFPRVRVLRAERNLGKGAAVRRGMLVAAGQWRLFSDADLSTPIEEVEGMLAVGRGGWDIVIASRGLPESRLEQRQPWWRELSGRSFNAMVRPLSGLPFHDTQCGFKLFSATAARQVFELQQCDGWAFDVEALMIAQRLGLRIREQPVTWRNDAASKVSLLGDAPRMFRDILSFRRRLHEEPALATPPPDSP